MPISASIKPATHTRRSVLGAAGAALAAVGLPIRRAFAAKPGPVPMGHGKPTLEEALRAALNGDAIVAAGLPGGIWHNLAPGNTPLALAVYDVIDPERWQFIHDHSQVSRGKHGVVITVFAHDDYLSGLLTGHIRSIMDGRTVEFLGGIATATYSRIYPGPRGVGYGGRMFVSGETHLDIEVAA